MNTPTGRKPGQPQFHNIPGTPAYELEMAEIRRNNMPIDGELRLGDLFGWTPEQTEAHEQQVARVKGLARQLRERLANLSTELGCEPEEVLKLLQRRIERRKRGEL